MRGSNGSLADDPGGPSVLAAFDDDDDAGSLLPPSVEDILLTHTNYFGLLLVFIPVITILGNLLVIVSVLRFRALHSAINFLILGLAVADLLVALFVMPYAVYVHVQNGEWFLGNLMCDIYMASDVACSTASILLLAVISFDRYRAVSRPIQYSRQAQNIRRVFIILGIIWLISVLVASPMVLGMNTRPGNANPHECRFYNAAYSIGSSIISFVIPCVLVLFVYIRIMLALKKREKAAKMRRISQLNTGSSVNSTRPPGTEDEEAGRIVAGPAVNVMMLALPSMSRRMRRFERHQRAINAAGGAPMPRGRRLFGALRRAASAVAASDDLMLEDDEEIEIELDDVDPRAPAASAAARGRAAAAAAAPAPAPLPLWHTQTSLSALPLVSALPTLLNDKDMGANAQERTSSTPRSSIDSLDEDQHVVTNDFVSDIYASRHSSDNRDSSLTHSGEFLEKRVRRSPRKFPNLARNYSKRIRRRSLSEEGLNTRRRHLGARAELLPSIIRQLSMRSPRLFRSSRQKRDAVVLSNPSSRHEENGAAGSMLARLSETEPLNPGNEELLLSAAGEGMQNASFSRSTTVNSELLGSPDHQDDGCPNPFIIENKAAIKQDASTSDESQPTVTFSMTVRAKAASPSQPDESTKLKECFDEGRRRSEDIVRILTRNIQQERREHPPRLPRLDSSLSVSEKSRSRNNSLKSVDSRSQSVKKKTNGGLAQRLVKRTMKHEQSLKRKVSKNQRKEKRATKTLGIVVGIFLICWVPFFSINILNAVCDVLNKSTCQVGFGPFFYTTWVGYMNSFMNPIIYTIFNTEFRRAFKSLIFGRNSRTAAFQRAQRVHL